MSGVAGTGAAAAEGDGCGTSIAIANSSSSGSISNASVSAGGGGGGGSAGEASGLSSSSAGTSTSSKFVVIEKEGTVWPSVPEAYERGSVIGVGASAKVYEATCLPNKRRVAIKVQNLDQVSVQALEQIRREISVMANMDHPNVVKYYTSFVVGNYLWMVMNYLAGGSLFDIMRWIKGTDGEKGEAELYFEETMIATVLRETLRGLEYFHKNGKIHRDVKAGNILIDGNGRVQIADFGVSAAIVDSGKVRKAQTFVGTPCWMAPEVMEQSFRYDYKADIWSFGITALELANGKPPNADIPPMKVLMNTLQNPPPKLEGRREKGYSKSFKEIITLCLNKNPSERPSASKLLEHKFFRSAKKEDYVRDYISKLPALSVRLRLLLHNEQASSADTAKDPNTLGWDFGDDDAATTTPAPNNSNTSNNNTTAAAATAGVGAPADAPSFPAGSRSSSSSSTASASSKFVMKDVSKPAAAAPAATAGEQQQQQQQQQQQPQQPRQGRFQVSNVQAVQRPQGQGQGAVQPENGAAMSTPAKVPVEEDHASFHTPPQALESEEPGEEEGGEDVSKMKEEMARMKQEIEFLKNLVKKDHE